MTTPPAPGQWFAFTPGDLDDDRLTAEQEALAVQAQQDRQDRPPPMGEIHVFLRSLEPGRSEVRFGFADRSSAISQIELPTAAIRELEAAREIFNA